MSTVPTLKIFGIKHYSTNILFFRAKVVGRSMEPTFKKGSYVVIKKVPFGNIRLFDIIAFYSVYHDSLIMHRVRNLHKQQNILQYVITKGDNNAYIDPWIVYQDMYVGIVQINKLANYLSLIFSRNFSFMNVFRKV